MFWGGFFVKYEISTLGVIPGVLIFVQKYKLISKYC